MPFQVRIWLRSSLPMAKLALSKSWHELKALLQDFTAAVWLLLSSLRSHALSSAITFVVALSASKQSHIAVAVVCEVQFASKFLKCSMAARQEANSVALGAGWLESWHASCTLRWN